jgi:ketosteroid isomerase-like protein
MSEENVGLVRELNEAVNRRDLDAFIALLSPDVVWEVNPELPGLREVYRGRAEVRDLVSELLEVGDSSSEVQLEEITDLGDGRVLADTLLTGRGKSSGVPVELHYWQVLWVAEGKIARRQVFMDRAEALEAAGLRE